MLLVPVTSLLSIVTLQHLYHYFVCGRHSIMFLEIKRYFETHNLNCQVNYRNNHLEDVQRNELQEIL